MPRKKPVIPHGVLDPTPDVVRSALAKNVKKIRIAKKLSQQRLADLSGVEWLTIQRIEKGRFNSLLATVARVRKALDVKWEKLLDGIE